MKIVIVEDEPVIAQRLQRQVSEILSEHQPKIQWIDNLDDAESLLTENPIDLLLLDLNLHGGDGFELLQTLTAQSFHTIIVSAYADQAIRAFEFGVLDFVAKPFNYQRLAQALERFTSNQTHSAHAAKVLSIKKPDRLHLIQIAQLQFAKANGHYSELHLADHSVHLHDKSIEKLTKLLPGNYLRIHRSYIVDFARIESLTIAPGGSYHVILKDKSELPVSRSRYTQVRQLIEG